MNRLRLVENSSSGDRSAASAAATAAATGLGDIFSGRNAAKFDGRTDILADLGLDLLQLTLGFKEIAGDLVREKRITGGLEFLDLGLAQLNAGTLLVGQFITALMHALVLKTGGIIGEEPLDLGLVRTERRIRDDLGAEFLGLRDNGGFFGNG